MPTPTPDTLPSTRPIPSPLWTRAWYAWIAAFVVIEGSALARRRPVDTLSDHVWGWCGITPCTPPVASVRLRRLGLLTFCAWVSMHFLSGDEV